MVKKLTVKETKIETETLIALATSDTITEAALTLGIARPVLYKRIQKFGLADQLKDIQDAAKAELLTATGKAARNLVNKIDSDDENISIRASTETLDRVGITKQNKNETSGNTYNFTQINAEMKGKYDD